MIRTSRFSPYGAETEGFSNTTRRAPNIQFLPSARQTPKPKGRQQESHVDGPIILFHVGCDECFLGPRSKSQNNRPREMSRGRAKILRRPSRTSTIWEIRLSCFHVEDASVISPLVSFLSLICRFLWSQTSKILAIRISISSSSTGSTATAKTQNPSSRKNRRTRNQLVRLNHII